MINNQATSTFGLLFVALLFTIVSCDSARTYEKWVDFDEMQWSADSIVTFDMELGDSLAEYDLVFGVRNTNLYPYQNLWLMMSLDGPDSISFQDTIQLQLAKIDGEWLGTRGAHLYTTMLPLYRDVKFYKPGSYALSIMHGMRTETGNLDGIASIGFRIEQND